MPFSREKTFQTGSDYCLSWQCTETKVERCHPPVHVPAHPAQLPAHPVQVPAPPLLLTPQLTHHQHHHPHSLRHHEMIGQSHRLRQKLQIVTELLDQVVQRVLPQLLKCWRENFWQLIKILQEKKKIYILGIWSVGGFIHKSDLITAIQDQPLLT